VVIQNERDASLLRKSINGSTEVFAGDDGLRSIVCRDDIDIVLISLVGFAGLQPTILAIEAGKDIALANKETLVVAGELIMQKVREKGIRLLPVDSEHSAILQCLQGEDIHSVDRLILAASGGPFLHLDAGEFAGITRDQALNHPTWKMGNKITIDSATLMNKGLEVIEAFWLFGLPAEKIDVIIHPQSIIHSMVEFVDGSVKAQLGIPDMRIPIQYALMYPERPASSFRRIDFGDLRPMTFFRPDMEKFPCLSLAFQALKTGGTAPVVLNAANEVAVELFLDGQIPFSSIPTIIGNALTLHVPVCPLTLDTVLRVDRETREAVRQHHASID
jgi:1-deoxy-D-xylulose-5-phosphate reductoisomerase